MAFNELTRTKYDIASKGSDIFRVQQVNENGSTITGAPVIDIGYLKDVNIVDKTTMEDIENEAGRVITQEEGKREVFFTATMLQVGANTLDIPKFCRGKFFRAYRKQSPTTSISGDEIFYGIGTITPQFDIKTPGGENPFEYKCIFNDTAITIPIGTITGSLTSGFAAVTASAVTIPAGEYYKVVSTAQTPS